MSDHGGALIQLLLELLFERAQGRGRVAFVIRCLVIFVIAAVAIYFGVTFWRVSFS